MTPAPASSLPTWTRLPAGALLYTVSICMLVALMLSGMLLLFSYARLDQDTVYFQELAIDNLESGKNLVLYGPQPGFGTFTGSLFASPRDSYHVEVAPWGVYGLLRAKGSHGPASARAAFLFGARPKEVFSGSLYLEDRSRPLMLAGKTYLEGRVYLPEQGVKAGFVGRSPYMGKQLVHGSRALSRAHEKGLAYVQCTDAGERLERVRSGIFGGGWALRYGDSLHGDWAGPVLELQSPYPIDLRGIGLSGHVIVTAPFVTVGPHTRLQDVLVFAKGIRIEKGYQGRGQFFASDSLVVAEDCRFDYPSALVLSCPAPHGHLVLGTGSQVEGLFLSDAAFSQPGAKTECPTTIESEAEVIGNCVVADQFDLKGTVTGHAMVGKFSLRTSAAVYENHLLDATIQSEGRSKRYAMPLIQGGTLDFIEIMPLR